jgi:hypothetical protein
MLEKYVIDPIFDYISEKLFGEGDKKNEDKNDEDKKDDEKKDDN